MKNLLFNFVAGLVIVIQSLVLVSITFAPAMLLKGCGKKKSASHTVGAIDNSNNTTTINNPEPEVTTTPTPDPEPTPVSEKFLKEAAKVFRKECSKKFKKIKEKIDDCVIRKVNKLIDTIYDNQ